MFHIVNWSVMPLSYGSRESQDGEPHMDSPGLPDITAQLHELCTKRGVRFDGIPLPYQVTRWARLTERLCGAARGFLAFPASNGLILNSSGPLSPVQWHNARTIAAQVIREHQIAAFTNGKPWTPDQRAVFQIEIAVPAMAGPDQLRAVFGAVDLTSDRHEEHIATVRILASAYNQASDQAHSA